VRDDEEDNEDEKAEEEDKLARLEEEENNPMKVLENKTVDSKREMDILDALQDIRARNARNERVGQTDDILSRIAREEVETEEDLERKRLEEEDEKLVEEVFSKVPASGASSSSVTVKRKADDVEPPVASLLSESARALIATHATTSILAKKRKAETKNSLGIKVVKKKTKT